MALHKYRVNILLSLLGLAVCAALALILFFLFDSDALRSVLIVSAVLVAAVMVYQIWLSATSVTITASEVEADERIRTMLDATPMICSLWDADGNLLDCNRETLNIIGYSEKKEYFEHFFEASPEFQPSGERSRDAIQRYSRLALETGYARYEWMALTSKGEPLPLDATLVRVPWKDGWRLATYARDMREIKAKEALVLETEERLRVMLDTMAFACVFFDSLGDPIDCNQRAVELFGCKDKEEFLGNFIRMSPEYQSDGMRSKDKIEQVLMNAFDTGKKTFLWDHVRLDGTLLPTEVTLIRVKWKDGYRIVAYVRDLSRLVEAEDKLKIAMHELAAAKEQAERALASEVQYNKAKTDFLSRVSHELLTPLNAILGITQVAQHDHSNAKINAAAEHLFDLVNDILDMTGFDTGKFNFTVQPFSFSTAMRQIVGNISQRAKVKEQIFTVNIDSGIHDMVLSDERRLKQVLQKLLLNAVKFTPEKGRIELSAKMLEDDGNKCTVRFEVIDNGIGITTQELENIWGVLEQADTSITRSHGGMGLGLPLTKRIIDLMEGSMLVESEPGKGSRFICEVRLGVVSNDSRETNNTQDCIIADLTGKRILIVDDQDINREILTAMLEDTGAVLDDAADGNEAVKMFSQYKYDLVLIDLHMPVMDGFTAAKAIRATAFAWAKTIPIISVSAETSAELHEKCIEAGINDHLPKPVEMGSMHKMIAKWIPKNNKE